MKQLIVKSILMHKYYWFVYFLMAAIFVFMVKDVLFIITFVSTVITMNEFYYDEKANGDKLWNSLPFTRKELVGSRYVSLLLNTIFATIFVFFMELVRWGTLQVSFKKEVVGSFLLVMLTASIFFPLLFGLKQRKIVFTFFVLYLLVISGGGYAAYYGYWHLEGAGIIPDVIKDWQIFTALFVMIGLLFLGSIRLSSELYSRRDFT